MKIPFKSDFRSFAPNQNLKKKTILLLLSGGADSVAAFYSLLKLKQNKLISRIEALHINYGLRGKESDGDAAFVKRLCKSKKIKLHLHKSVLNKGADLQNRARQIRWDLARETAIKNSLSLIVTAHHLNDHCETLIHNQRRGAGLAGLTGLQIVRSDQSGKLVYRPLLRYKKQELINWLKKNNYSWREDSSNAGLSYERNRIRNNVLLRPINPKAELILESACFQLGILNGYYKSRCREMQKNYRGALPDQIVKNLTSELLFRFLQAEAQIHHHEISRAQFERLTADRLLQYGSFTWRRDSEGLWQFPVPSVSKTFYNEGEYSFLDIMVSIKSIPQKNIKWPLNDGFKQALMLNQDSVFFPLTIRLPQTGDQIVPFGHGQALKIGDVMKKKNIGILRRKYWPVVVDATGTIIAIPSVEIADSVQVTKTAQKVYKLTIHPRGDF